GAAPPDNWPPPVRRVGDPPACVAAQTSYENTLEAYRRAVPFLESQAQSLQRIFDAYWGDPDPNHEAAGKAAGVQAVAVREQIADADAVVAAAMQRLDAE